MLKQDPKISVIMPTYNGSRSIKESIDSILAQTFNDFELIIINDGSRDNTKNIIKSYEDRRIVYLENRRNSGVPRTRNKGLRIARGEYIAYCDHDDIYYPRHLERFAETLNAHPECGLVYAKFTVSRPDQPDVIRPKTGFSKERLEVKNIIGPPLNFMHRKTCLKKTGGFDESHTITKYDSEDHYFLLLLSDYFNFTHIDEILGEYRYHSSNRCLSLDPSNSYEYITRKRIKRYSEDKSLPEYIDSCSVGVINELISFKKIVCADQISKTFLKTKRNYQTIACLGMCHLAKGNFKEAGRLLEMSVKKMPGKYKNLGLWQREDIFTINIYLARAYYHLGRSWTAIKICKKILRDSPGNLNAKIQLSLAYLKTGHPDKSLGIIKDIKYVPEVSHLRGCCYFRNKEFALAAAEFKAAAESCPKIAFYRHNLKHALAKNEK